MRNRFLDGLWLLALGLYVVAGLPIATFHGDEAMQVWMSHDYATAFIYHEPQRLTTNPPYDIDSEPQLRLINGSINRYAIGLSWHLAGFTNGDLPPRPGWDWGLDYDTNVATNHRPPARLLNAARVSSTLFFALSIAVMFGLGWQLGGAVWGRPLAYFASLLYTLHPVLLLNGRRAMMEGSMLLFGLLAVLIAVIISRKGEQGKQGWSEWGWWLALTLAGGLAVVSKHTGVIFIAGALGWIFVSELLNRRWQPLIRTTLKLIVSFALMFAIFIALSPALWNDPPMRLQNLIEARAILLNIQMGDDPALQLTIPQRVLFIAFQPFIAPLAHYELTLWRAYDPITAEIQRYMASPLSGVQFGYIVGAILTVLMLIGILILAVPRLRPRSISLNQAAGLLIWLLVTCAALLSNPLPWQRYYLPLMPIAILLVGICLMRVAQIRQEKSAIVTSTIPLHTER